MKSKDQQLLEESYRQVNENQDVQNLVDQLDNIVSSGYGDRTQEDLKLLDKEIGKLIRKHLNNPALLAKVFHSYARLTGGEKTFREFGDSGVKEYGIIKKHLRGK
jgi:predicted Zn-dependent peptidase